MSNNTYVCTFVGRRKGAIGITYPITKILRCKINRVIPQLYNEYQDIFNLSITTTLAERYEPVDVEYAIEVAHWLPGE